MKNLCFFCGSFFKIKIADVLNFWWIKYLGKSLPYLKTWGTGVNYCWNCRPTKLLLHFIVLHFIHRLDQLNNKLTKIAVNSTMQYFEGSTQKKCLLKVWIFGPPTTKWWPCKIFTKLNGNHLLMANIFKLQKYQTFGLMKMHNMNKIWFANNKFNLWTWNKKYFS